MKAWVLHGINDIRYEEVDKPVPGKEQVLVKVMAAGVCGSDIPRVYDTGAHSHPLIIGHEFSGVVEQAGPGAKADLNGKRVGVFPLIPCRKCGLCMKEKYEMCKSYDYLGSRSNGGFAEYALVPSDNLIELPGRVSFQEAAMLEPMSVAVHALRKATGEFTFDKNKRIAVCGLGTIGLLLTEFLLDAGYENLYVIGNKEFQIRKAKELGLAKDRILSGRGSDAADILSRIGGADLFFECVGKNECVSLGVSAASPGGTVMLVGNPASDMTLDRSTYWKILRNQLTLLGTWNSSFTGKDDDDWHYVLSRLSDKGVHPERLITHKLRLFDLEKGLILMRDKTEDYCKVMVDTQQ